MYHVGLKVLRTARAILSTEGEICRFLHQGICIREQAGSSTDKAKSLQGNYYIRILLVVYI